MIAARRRHSFPFHSRAVMLTRLLALVCQLLPLLVNLTAYNIKQPCCRGEKLTCHVCFLRP